MPNLNERTSHLSFLADLASLCVVSSCLAWWTCVPARLMAQGDSTSAIVGTVTDSSGAAVAGAMVTFVGTDTGSKRSARTDDAGRFNFPQLKPGMYSVKAEADRFESRTNESVWAGLGQRQTVAFILTPAGVKGEVTVTSLAPLVNPDNPNTSTTLQR